MDVEEQQNQAEGLKENLKNIKHKILVMSGKGGVGKSTVAVNVAYYLAQKGNRVGILDVDIHGPNVAKMLGIDQKKITFSEDKMIDPVSVFPNLKAIGISMFLNNIDQPLIWRGPRKFSTIQQLLKDVYWGPLDYLVIDSPPGTGDEPLGVCQLIPDINGAVIVTTPQEVAILDSRKSIMFTRAINVPVLGIIENMSGFVCPHCQKAVMLFGQGGGEAAAYDLHVPFLGRIPIDPRIVIGCDSGKPFIESQTECPSAKAMVEIIDNIGVQLKNGIKKT